MLFNEYKSNLLIFSIDESQKNDSVDFKLFCYVVHIQATTTTLNNKKVDCEWDANR
jgi:hypothetical protein